MNENWQLAKLLNGHSSLECPSVLGSYAHWDYIIAFEGGA